MKLWRTAIAAISFACIWMEYSGIDTTSLKRLFTIPNIRSTMLRACEWRRLKSFL
jgi:coenzyme F420-reducing hydrogenase delta subunit